MLTLAEANQAIAAAVARATAMKIKIAVSICDEEGRLVAFQRMDGVFSESIPLAIGKAIAAAASRKSGSDKDAVLALQLVWRWPAWACRSTLAQEVCLSLATPRGWAPWASPGAQDPKKTSNAPKPVLKLWIRAVDRFLRSQASSRRTAEALGTKTSPTSQCILVR